MPHSRLLQTFTSRDLQLHIADLIARDDIGPCGQPHSVSTKPGAVDRYEVDAALVCGACARLDEHRKAHDHDAPGVLLRVIDVTARDAAASAGPDEFGPTFD